MDNSHGGEDRGDGGETNVNNTIVDPANAVPVPGEQETQFDGYSQEALDTYIASNSGQEICDTDAALFGGNTYPEAAAHEDIDFLRLPDLPGSDSESAGDDDIFFPPSPSEFPRTDTRQHRNATAVGNAGSDALEPSDASELTEEESLEATINEELRSVENARQVLGRTQANETGNGQIEDDAGNFFRGSLRDGAALNGYKDNLTSISTYLHDPRSMSPRELDNAKACKSRFVDLNKIRQPIEKALEIGGPPSDFDYLEFWSGYNQSDITDLLDFLRRLVTNTNSKSKKMSTIWSNAKKRVENCGPQQLGRNGNKYKFSQRVVDHLVELSASQLDLYEMHQKITEWIAWCNVQTITTLVLENGNFRTDGNQFGLMNYLLSKYVDDVMEGGFTGLESFLGSEHGAAMRDELLGLAEGPAEKDTSTWFDKATHFVCYHPERPFQTVIDSLVDDSQPRAYWWIDLVSNARPRGQNDSTRVDSFVAIRSTQSFAMVIDDWQNPSVVSRESCRAEIAVAVDEGRILRAVMPKAVRESLEAFSNNVMRSKQDEAPEDDRRDGQAEIDKLSDALQSQGKRLEASNKYSAQIDLKTRLAIIEVILKPAKDLIRQHTGPGNPTPLLDLIERSLDVVDA
ncbi:Hypothetical Protein FCC1311_022952, partial [Hondaea fermentalgiana]